MVRVFLLHDLFSRTQKIFGSRLLLTNNDLVEMRTSDNRSLSMRCNKVNEGVPCIDLLPRMRYTLRVDSSLPTDARVSYADVFFFQWNPCYAV